jgi:lysozyme
MNAVMFLLALAAPPANPAAFQPLGGGEAPAAVDDCGVPKRLEGIDVSSFQGAIDWRQVRKAGIEFAFVRFADGLEVLDQRFAQNYRAMRRVRIRRGVYQVFRASLDPKKQADLLLEAVRRAGPADLPLVADVETDDGMPPDEVRRRLLRWLRRVESKTHRRPIVYTSPSMSETLGRGFGRYHLWVAHYDVGCPRTVDGWRGWAFWQRSSSGTVAGISGNVDLDSFAGTKADLRLLGRGLRMGARVARR